MEAVMFLIVVLVVSCGLSLWTCATARADRKRVAALESVVANQGRILSSLVDSSSSSVALPTTADASALSDALAGLDSSALSDAQTVLANASADDLAAAAELLSKLGIGG